MLMLPVCEPHIENPCLIQYGLGACEEELTVLGQE